MATSAVVLWRGCSYRRMDRILLVSLLLLLQGMHTVCNDAKAKAVINRKYNSRVNLILDLFTKYNQEERLKREANHGSEEDIDECASQTLNKCTDICVNTLGGFTCSCPLGKKLGNDKFTCEVCDSEHYGEECREECGCGVGSDRCDPETGCVCKTGWLGPKCDEDKNECSDVTTTCPANSECVNNPGSYRCECRTGFLLNTTTNTCDDVDECATGKHDCNQLCSNNEGSFACDCRFGFVLSQDRRTCVATTTCQPSTNCEQQCQVEAGVASCSCNQGFKLNGDGKTCTDIDECNEGPDPCAAGGAQCTNIDNGGGFACSCSVGFKLQSDGVTCLACEEGNHGVDCANN